MTKKLNGDLTMLNPNKPGVIIQQVNCQNKMGAGLALSLKERWPKISQDYHNFCQNMDPNELLGRIQTTKLGPNFYCVNSFTQIYYGRNGHFTNENMLIRNIRKVSQHAKNHNWPVYIPDHIGAGLAGGDWNKIKNGIKDLDNINIVNFEKGIEPKMENKQKQNEELEIDF